MYKILFVCHGNICRSPMAEFVFRDMLEKRGITGVEVASAATSTEEIGNGVHYGTAAILRRLGIDYSDKKARQMTRSDFGKYDLLVGMDSANIRNIKRIAGQTDSYGANVSCVDKIHRLLDFADNSDERRLRDERRSHDIPDPWYTGDFESTYADIEEGCEGLIHWLQRSGII